MAERPMTNIMEKSCKSYFQLRLFGCALIRISSRVVFDEVAHVLLAKIGGSDAMLKTGMHSRRKYKVQSSKLLNFPESLKLWSVDDPPNLLVKANEAMNAWKAERKESSSEENAVSSSEPEEKSIDPAVLDDWVRDMEEIEKEIRAAEADATASATNKE